MNISEKEEKIITDYILGYTEIITDDLKTEAENYYFACCLLMPTESVLKRVTELGGFDSVLNNMTFQQYLSNYYRVPLNPLRVRLISLQQDTLKEQSESIKRVYKK